MRARFTTEEIAVEALRLVDQSGLRALSMRSLAAALHTGPMTLYNYVPDKAGLEDLVVAAIVAQIQLPEPTDDWLRDTYAVAEAASAGLRAHPAALPLVLTRPSVTTVGSVIRKALVAALRRGGLTDTDVRAASQAVLGLVIATAHTELVGDAVDEHFTLGMRMLLDGVAARAQPSAADTQAVVTASTASTRSGRQTSRSGSSGSGRL